jgi:hypothetical protein
MATFWTDIGMCFESFQRLGRNEKKEARANEIAGAQAIQSANGMIPVVIGEYGISSGALGAVNDPGGMQVTQAVDQSGYGSAAWAWTSGDPSFPVLLNDPGGNPAMGLTPLGQAVAQHIDTCGTPAPIVIPQAQGTASQNASPQASLPPGSTALTAQSGPSCPDMTVPGAVTPGGGSFADAAGDLYAINANNGDVASVNGAPINNGAYQTSQLTQGSDGTIYGQDENSHQWFALMGSGGDTWWQPLAFVPAAIMSAGLSPATVANSPGANPCSSGVPQTASGQQNPASGVLSDILQVCANAATIANPTNADLCSKAFANQALLDQIGAQLAAAQQAGQK